MMNPLVNTCSFINNKCLKSVNLDFVIKENENIILQSIEKVNDTLYINNYEVILFLTNEQQNGRFSNFSTIKEETISFTKLNVSILNHLLNYTSLIPDTWQSIGYIYFWGTIYNEGYNQYVNCIKWNYGEGFVLEACNIRSGIFRSSCYSAVIDQNKKPSH